MQKDDQTIPFLDINVYCSRRWVVIGHIVYRKPTHTDTEISS